MGWASGTGLFEEIWFVVRQYLTPMERVSVCASIIDTLEDRDWDTQDEVIRDDWPEVKAALKLLHPDWEFDV